MKNTTKRVSFHIVPGSNGIAEAEGRLRNVGFEQIQRNPDGRTLHIVASQDLVERVLGCSLVEKKRRRRVGALQREAVDLELPEGMEVPPSLKDVVTEIIFPMVPNYHSNLSRHRGF
jgi:hypothetical protein